MVTFSGQPWSAIRKPITDEGEKAWPEVLNQVFLVWPMSLDVMLNFVNLTYFLMLLSHPETICSLCSLLYQFHYLYGKARCYQKSLIKVFSLEYSYKNLSFIFAVSKFTSMFSSVFLWRSGFLRYYTSYYMIMTDDIYVGEGESSDTGG